MLRPNMRHTKFAPPDARAAMAEHRAKSPILTVYGKHRGAYVYRTIKYNSRGVLQVTGNGYQHRVFNLDNPRWVVRTGLFYDTEVARSTEGVK